VQTSLFEALLDLQFELLTTRLNDPTIAVQRKGPRSAHAFLPAPYGIYPCSDGYLAIAMNPVPAIGRLLGLHELVSMSDPSAWWERQEEIEELIADRLRTGTRDAWLALLDAEDVWCAPVLTLEELISHEGFAAIAMTQEISGADVTLTTTRSPIRVDGHRLTSARPGPWLGEHDAELRPAPAEQRA
jgi:crotonobetainyl-CoA:carnitine CoA-transferase CaiB-like acyl-CoA transferase